MNTGQEAGETLIERLKELNCLLRISKLVARDDADLEIILKQTVEILPQAFQEPEKTCARIIYNGYDHVSDNFHLQGEGIHEPIQINRKTEGFVEVYSFSEKNVSHSRSFLVEEQALLSAIADQIGVVISKKKAEQSLHATMARLREKSIQLENKNIALTEFLDQIQSARESYIRAVQNQIEGSVLPALHRILQNPKADPDIREYAAIAREALEDISSAAAFSKDRDASSLSPREMEICSLIKRGLSTKEICSLLGLSIQTVEKHRYNIRRKIGISRKKINLAVFLRDF